MGTARTVESRRTLLLERMAQIAREQGPGSFADRLRSRMGDRPSDHEALVMLIEDLVAADEGLADVGPSIASLLRSVLAADAVTAVFVRETATGDDLDDVLSPDDVLRIARVRGQAEAAILAEPAFEASRVAEALGSSSKNPREFARQVRNRPGMVALRYGNRYVFPAFQFNEGRKEVWPIAAEVNILLGASEQPWAVASFWFSPDAHLGARPADVVADPARADDIRQAARRELAPVG
ncbi:MAG TPA: hypothetical protein VIM30_07395 [Candidatus Limnocylindrales bacterium]|jgi:hypothetical protein